MSSYPQRFGKYLLLSRLAQGGMGELHLALTGQTDLRKLCVLKTIISHLVDEEFVLRFVDEAKVVMRLSHGNIVQVFDAGEVGGQYYIAMEYIEGKDLWDVYKRMEAYGHRFPLPVALYIIKELCRGLAYVHQFGDLNLVHRDVSPPNVLLSYNGEVRITDFGLATSTLKIQKTAPGILVGKLSYMSPEQAANTVVDSRSDIYSLGVILWELATGKRLFPHDGPQIERLTRAMNPDIPAPSKIDPQLPPALDLITSRALAINKEQRYADAEMMRKDLVTLLAKISPTTDAQAVQALLHELYQDRIEEERLTRREMIEKLDLPHQNFESDITPIDDSPKPHSAELTLPGVAVHDPKIAERGSSPYLTIGSTLTGRYEILSMIGEGGMGIVYLAKHVEIDKQVAIKVLMPVLSRMPDVVSRFRREARAASCIGHPHIVEVFDSGTTEDGCIFFVMEHLTGIDLAEVLRNEERLSIERALNITTQISEAIAAAHEAGIIHRDLKPENIFLTLREGTADFVKILDFGIAISANLEEQNPDRLTSPGMAMGTPEYMAPEQAMGRPSDHRVDIYGLGILLYEMLIGHPPHEGETYVEVFHRKETEEIKSLRELREDISEDLDKLVRWSLQHNPEERPQTVNQFLYELNKITKGRPGAVASLLGLPAASMNKATPPSGYFTIPANAGGPPSQLIARPPNLAQTESSWRTLIKQKSVYLPVGATLVLIFAAIGFLSLRSSKQEQIVASQTLMPQTATTPAVDNKDKVKIDAEVKTNIAESETSLPTSTPAASLPASKKAARPMSPAFSKLGWEQIKLGQFNAARNSFTAALKHPRERASALLGLAEIDFQLGRYEEAAKFARQANALEKSIRTKLKLGNIYFKLGELKKAIELYQQVLKDSPNHAEAKRNLEAARKRLGQPKK